MVPIVYFRNAHSECFQFSHQILNILHNKFLILEQNFRLLHKWKYNTKLGRMSLRLHVTIYFGFRLWSKNFTWKLHILLFLPSYVNDYFAAHTFGLATVSLKPYRKCIFVRTFVKSYGGGSAWPYTFIFSCGW